MEDMHLLGFDVDLHQRTIAYMPPDASWKIRDHASAGSTRLRLSGFHSRAHLIRKYTYPPSAVERALAQLADLYVQKGHDLHSCRQALRKSPHSELLHFRGFPCTLSPPQRAPTTICVCQRCFQGFLNLHLTTVLLLDCFQQFPTIQQQGGLVVHASTSPTKRLALNTDIGGDAHRVPARIFNPARRPPAVQSKNIVITPSNPRTHHLSFLRFFSQGLILILALASNHLSVLLQQVELIRVFHASHSWVLPDDWYRYFKLPPSCLFNAFARCLYRTMYPNTFC